MMYRGEIKSDKIKEGPRKTKAITESAPGRA